MLTELIIEKPGADAMTMRPARMEDLEEAVELFNECAISMTGRPGSDLDGIRAEWELPEFDLAESTMVAVTPEGRLAGYIEVWDTSSLPVRIWVWGRVHPAFEGLGIGSRLMRWAELRSQRALSRVPEDLRVVMEAGTYIQNQSASQLLAHFGMKPVRRFLTMAIDLDGQPFEAEWPAAIQVRTMASMDELADVIRATDDAFQDHWGYVEQPFDERYRRWLHFLENSNDFDPSLWYLAMDGNEIAGMSLCWLRSDMDPEMGWVGTLGVRRPWRRQGLGLALLKHSFHALLERGQKSVGLGVDSESLTGATRLYEKAGMSAILEFEVSQKELRPGKDVATRSLEE
jgi:mycothiol synthase